MGKLPFFHPFSLLFAPLPWKKVLKADIENKYNMDVGKKLSALSLSVPSSSDKCMYGIPPQLEHAKLQKEKK